MAPAKYGVASFDVQIDAESRKEIERVSKKAEKA